MESTECPICDRSINMQEIERHVNQCIFLNSNNEIPLRKRKENSISPRPAKTAKISLVSSNTSNGDVRSSLSSEPSSSSAQTTSTTSHITNEKQTQAEGKRYNFEIPLAEVLRPSIFDDFVGQQQIVGKESLIRKLLDQANVPSLILWGPPGCGKTTLANVLKEILIQKSKKHGVPIRFVKLYATMAGVSDVKEVIKIAKNERQMFQKKTILFMDEIHRFNKSQQDTFLPHIESGTITLIGATTENPSFSLNNALLSRCRVITMDKLLIENIVTILQRAVNFLDGCIVSPEKEKDLDSRWCIDTETIEWLAGISDGDARISLNSLQMAVQSKQPSQTTITLNDIKDSIKKSHIMYDKKGEEHYNIISAVHKSIRASDENAALYWLTRMLKGGEDPIFIARRLVRAASEDIGLADSNALVLAVSTMQGCQLIGMPECDVLLAQLAVYLARCPKSTDVYHALNRAKTMITNHKGPLPSVPLHLRNAPTRLMKNLGYSKNYNTAHKSVSGLEYMPEGYEQVNFFERSTEKTDDE